MSGGATWSATAYRIDGGGWQCVDHSNVSSGNSGTGTSRTRGEITLPGALPGGAAGHTVEFRMHESNSCSESSNYSSTTVTINPAIAERKANPNLAASCGSLKVVLVLDESGSITNTASYVTNVKAAAKAFVNGLKGTGASLAVVEFDETATKPLGSNYVPISDPVPAAWTNYIDNQYGSNSFWSTGTYTNWQDAMAKTAEFDATANADLVVFITDGDPTAYGVSPATITTGQPDGYFTGLKPAFDLANRLKLGGSHLLAVGVGNAVGADSDAPNKKLRLKGISDDEELAVDCHEHQDRRRRIRDGLLASRERPEEHRDGALPLAGDGLEAGRRGRAGLSAGAAGAWQFTAGRRGQYGLVHAGIPAPAPGRCRRPGWPARPSSGSRARSSRRATSRSPRQRRPNYAMTGVTCTNGVTATPNLAGGSFFIDNLPYTGSTTCTVRNQRKTGTIQLKKQFTGGPASQRADLFIKQNGSTISGGFADDVASGGGTAVLTVPTGSFDISELAGANTDFAVYSKTWACTKNGTAFIPSTPGSSGSVAVGVSDNVVCTFTNTFVKQVAQVATQSSPGSSTVVPGTSVSDSATVTPVVAGQQVASGTVKFFLCQPSEVTAGGCEGQAGTQVGSPAAGETVNGSGVAQSDAAANTSAVGKYCWRAEYSGDGFYGASSQRTRRRSASRR